MDDKQSLLPPSNPNPYQPVVNQPQIQQFGQPQLGQPGIPQYAPTLPNYQAADQVYSGQIQGTYGHQYNTGDVVTGQPRAQHLTTWSSGLCDCTMDVPSCLLECFCGLCSRANMATRLGETCFYGLCCGFHFTSVARPYIRAKHNIQGTLMSDCCMTCWCQPCSMCQLSRELNKRQYPRGCLF